MLYDMFASEIAVNKKSIHALEKRSQRSDSEVHNAFISNLKFIRDNAKNNQISYISSMYFWLTFSC